MPARFQLEVKAAVIAAARKELSFPKDKLNMHMRPVRRTRIRMRRCPNRTQQSQSDDEPYSTHV
jgi:hypothetical protein